MSNDLPNCQIYTWLEEKKRPAYVDSLTHDFNHKRKQKSADPAFTAPFDNAGPSL